MAVDQKDVTQVAEELKQQFEQFKSANDKRLDGIVQEKAALAGQVDTRVPCMHRDKPAISIRENDNGTCSLYAQG